MKSFVKSTVLSVTLGFTAGACFAGQADVRVEKASISILNDYLQLIHMSEIDKKVMVGDFDGDGYPDALIVMRHNDDLHYAWRLVTVRGDRVVNLDAGTDWDNQVSAWEIPDGAHVGEMALATKYALWSFVAGKHPIRSLVTSENLSGASLAKLSELKQNVDGFDGMDVNVQTLSVSQVKMVHDARNRRDLFIVPPSDPSGKWGYAVIQEGSKVIARGSSEEMPAVYDVDSTSFSLVSKVGGRWRTAHIGNNGSIY